MSPYLLLVLAVVALGFAFIKVLHIIVAMTRGAGIGWLGMFFQPLYVGVGLALGLWLLHLGGWVS